MALKILPYLLFLLLFNSALAGVSKFILDKVNKGEIYVASKELEDAPWPEYTIATVVDAKTEEAIAIFSAYYDQKKFVPGVISSVPVKHITPTDVHVAFEMYMPWPLSNTFYTTGNILTKNIDGSFKVSWYYVKSDSTKDNRGSATFIPYQGKTLLIYNSFILPDSSFASLVSGKVKGDLIKTIKAIKRHLEVTASDDRGAVKHYLKLMHDSLSGKNIYNDMILDAKTKQKTPTRG